MSKPVLRVKAFCFFVDGIHHHGVDTDVFGYRQRTFEGIGKQHLSNTMDAKPPGRPSTAKTASTANLDESDYGPPDLVKLRSALATLDPDCDEETWKLKRLAPLATAARIRRRSAPLVRSQHG